MLNINRYQRIKTKGLGEIYEDRQHGILISVFNLNDSGIEKNNKWRIQLDAKKRDLLKTLSIKGNKQLILLAKRKISENKYVYIYAPTDYYLLREFDIRSSIWFSDKSAILDAYVTGNIQYGKEDKNKITTICFSNDAFESGIDEILSTMPKLKSFNEINWAYESEFDETLNNLKENDKIKELIGYLGEYIFYKQRKNLKINNLNIQKTLWNYLNGLKYENHDFNVELENMENYFVEVKTASPSSDSHYISNNEIDFMVKNKNNYSLVSIELNNKFMSLIYSDEKINSKDIDQLIHGENYNMEIFNGYQEIEKSFTFKSTTFSMERAK